MSGAAAPASEVRLSDGEKLEVAESVEVILNTPTKSLGLTQNDPRILVMPLTLEDGRQVYVAAGHIVSIRPVAPPRRR